MASTETPANKKYGYDFGCEGVAELNEACHLLGVASFNTVRKYAGKGLIRIGKHKGNHWARTVICRRSIREYLASLEN